MAYLPVGPVYTPLISTIPGVTHATCLAQAVNPNDDLALFAANAVFNPVLTTVQYKCTYTYILTILLYTYPYNILT